MGSGGANQVILDTSVLINFLRVDRLDLLGNHPNYEFIVTDHVRGEITDHYPDQVERLSVVINNQFLTETPVSGDEELDVFARLLEDHHLGIGESSAIAAAIVREHPLAIDDKVARKRATQVHPELQLLDTVMLMKSLIQCAELDVNGADRIKADWEESHRFKGM